MSLHVRIRRLLLLCAITCVVLAGLLLYRVNVSLVDELTELNASSELGKVEAAFLDQLSILRVRAHDWVQQPERLPANSRGVGHLDILLEIRDGAVHAVSGNELGRTDALGQLSRAFQERGCAPIWGVTAIDGRPLLFSSAAEEGCHAFLLGVWLDSDWMRYLSNRVGHALYVRVVPQGLSVERGIDPVHSGDNLLGRFPLVDYLQLAKAPMEVVVELPAAGYQEMRRAMMVSIAVMFVFSMTAVMIANKRIQTLVIGRLGVVHNAVRAIARGGALDQRIPLLGSDEIGSLAEDFNRMVDSLQHGQAQLAEARKQAEEASLTKSQFLANISHEIRTPMTAILGYTELLRDGGLSEQERAHFLTIIQHNGDALLALINDVLDLSRIEAGQLLAEHTAFSLLRVLDEVVSTLLFRAEEKGIELVLDIPNPLPPYVEGDAYRLRQIVMNLVGNAVKFTRQGRVSVRAQWQPEMGVLTVAVSDTGIGIRATALETIFQPFSQADASHTREYAGTGLGLSIARQLARSQGGDIQVESEADKGSCFTLTLPFAVPESSSSLDALGAIDHGDAMDSPAAPAAVEAASLKGRVLLVEDNDVNRLLVRKMLEREGLSVTEAEHGEAAIIAFVQQRDFDLVVLDMQMPVMDGYETVEALRDRAYHGPILALTANVLAEDRQRCLDAGCDAFLGKPVRSETLIKTVASLLSHSSVEDADDEIGA